VLAVQVIFLQAVQVQQELELLLEQVAVVQGAQAMVQMLQV
jgi:hypothetical protein